jgi:hypothetical protein
LTVRQGHDFDFRDEVRLNRIGDDAGQALFGLEDFRHASHRLGAVLDAHDERAAGGICKSDERLENTFRGRQIALEFECLSLIAEK